MASGYQQYGGNPYGDTDSSYGDNRRNPYGQDSRYDEQQTASGYGTQAAAQTRSGNSQAGYGASTNPYGESDGYNSSGRAELGTQGGYGDAGVNPATSNYNSSSNNYVRQTGSMAAPITQVHEPAYPMPTQVPSARAAAQNAQPASANVASLPNQGMVNQGSTVLSNPDFLARVDMTRSEIRKLSQNVEQISTTHQRILGAPDSHGSAQLENLVAQTQILNTQIKDQIKYLETDAAKSNHNTTKDSQIRTLKQNFKSQLEDYQKEEQVYRQRYREQIARQYRIVNPEATEQEVREASDADWGDEGVFQTALKSNRTGAANSVLGSVRARHNDIQQIEKTLIELNQLFQDLAEAVVLQEAPIQQTEQQTTRVKEDTEAGNKHLQVGIKHARNRRKLKWWCFFIVVLIIVIVALVVGLVVAHDKGLI